MRADLDGRDSLFPLDNRKLPSFLVHTKTETSAAYFETLGIK